MEMLGEDGGGSGGGLYISLSLYNALGLECMYHHPRSFVYIVTRYVRMLV